MPQSSTFRMRGAMIAVAFCVGLLTGCNPSSTETSGTPSATPTGRPANLGAKDPSADTAPAASGRPTSGAAGDSK